MRWWFAALAVIVGVGLILFGAITEAFWRYWAYALGPVISLLLLGIWWSLVIGVSWRSKGRRLLQFCGAVLVAILALIGLSRFDGSSGGSSLPRLAWRWSQPAGIDSAAPTPDSLSTAPLAVATTEVLPDAIDAHRFLGDDHGGSISGIALAPDWIAKPPEICWRQPIGLGWSSFAVDGRRAITTEQRGDDEWVSCYDLATGELLWHHAHVGVRFSEPMGGDGPRSTPAILGDKVFVLGATGILDCLRIETGEAVWSRNILDDADAPNLEWAVSASPLLTPAGVVVPGGKNTGPELLCYRLVDGEEVWRTGSNGGSYSTPRLVQITDEAAILHVHGAGVAAHDVATGKTYWDYPWGDGFPKVGQPHVLPGDRVLVTASYNQGTHLLQVSGTTSAGFEVEEIWQSRRMKTKFSSVTVRDGFAYGLDEGMFACIDLETGDRVWKDGRYGFGQHLEVGQHLLLLAERGRLVLIDPTPEGHEELATYKVFDEKCWAAPTLAGAYCLIRSESEVACVKLPLRSAAVDPAR